LELVGFDSIDLETVVIAPHIVTNALTFKPQMTLGIGCNRGTSFEAIEQAFQDFVTKHQLDTSQIKNIASFEAKKDEQGLLDFVAHHDWEIVFYSKEAINSLEQIFSKSASTKFFGLKGVAEPSAVLGSFYKELIIKKEVYNKAITIAGAI
jgi:cobalt-precorrin 5A hydrolase